MNLFNIVFIEVYDCIEVNGVRVQVGFGSFEEELGNLIFVIFNLLWYWKES